MMSSRSRAGMLAVALALASCGPAAPSGTGRAGEEVAPGEAGRTLVLVARGEPGTLSRKFPRTGTAAGSGTYGNLFDAVLFQLDEFQNPEPYLAEAVPRFNTDSWRLLSDGRMETTYTLKHGLTWHDGAPHTADDYVFAWRVFSRLDMGWRPMPQNLMEAVVPRDSRTLGISWSQPFPRADSLGTEFPPLPRHILEVPFQESPPDAFMALPYWTTGWVGLGPYKLDRWEPGAFIEGVAFDGHALGRPKITRVRGTFNSEPNVAVAQLLSGAADVAIGDSIDFQQGVLLKRSWANGIVIMEPTEVRFMHVQHRVEVAKPQAILDVRVRKALAHALDRHALNEGLLDGEGKIADTLLPPHLDLPAVDRAIVTYPYDLRRTEQLMGEAGFSKGRDGFYMDSTGVRLPLELWAIAGHQNQQEIAIIADGYRQAGIDGSFHVVPAAQSRDGQVLANFPSLFPGSSNHDEDGGLDKLLSTKVPRPESRWTGSALGGYSNPEYDRLYNVFFTSFQQSERQETAVQMSKIISEEVAALPMYHALGPIAHVADLKGPRAGRTTAVHEWAWAS